MRLSPNDLFMTALPQVDSKVHGDVQKKNRFFFPKNIKLLSSLRKGVSPYPERYLYVVESGSNIKRTYS